MYLNNQITGGQTSGYIQIKSKEAAKKANINGTDKITRIVLAMIFASLYFTGVITGTAGIILLAAGAILLLTAFMNFCPIYHFLGLSTKKITTDHKNNNQS